MNSPQRIVRGLVSLVMTGLLAACAATRSADVGASGAPSEKMERDPRHGITIDAFSGYPIRGGGTR
jgi:hypothetical protein